MPYGGGAPALTDMIAGQMQVMFDNMPASSSTSNPASCARLAVTSTVRSEALPDVPLVADFVPGYEASAWYGLGAPKGTPRRDRRHGSTRRSNEILADPEDEGALAELGATLLPGSAAEFGKLVADETEKWGKVVKVSGIKAD